MANKKKAKTYKVKFGVIKDSVEDILAEKTAYLIDDYSRELEIAKIGEGWRKEYEDAEWIFSKVFLRSFAKFLFRVKEDIEPKNWKTFSKKLKNYINRRKED